MVDWFTKLCKAFFEFRDAHNWRCKYPEHSHDHYQDEIRTDGIISEWLYHDNTIAKLRKRFHETEYELYLTNAGYDTRTTIDRLNGIIRCVEELYGISIPIEFKLKYDIFSRVATPLYTYIRINNKDYYLQSVTVVLDLNEKKVLKIIYEPSQEIRHFRDDRKLEKYRKIYNEIRTIMDEIRKIFEQIENKVVNEVLLNQYWDAKYKYWELVNEFYYYIKETFVMSDNRLYAVFVWKLQDAERLYYYRMKFKEMHEEAKKLLLKITLLQ